MTELYESFLTFIEEHANDDTVSLRLKMSRKTHLPLFLWRKP